MNGAGSNASNNIVIVPGKGLNTDAGGMWTVGCWLKTTTAGGVLLYPAHLLRGAELAAREAGGDDEDRERVAGKADIIVAKQRNGPVGDVKVKWQKDFTLFEDDRDVAGYRSDDEQFRPEGTW